MFSVVDSTIDGMAEEVRKGSSKSEDIDAMVIQRTLLLRLSVLEERGPASVVMLLEDDFVMYG